MLSKRIISALVLIALISIVIFFDWICGLVVTLFIMIGLHEYFVMLEKKGIKNYKYFGIGMGAVIPLSIMFRFEPTKSWELLFIVLALFFLLLMQFKRRDSSGVIVDISTTIFGILYVSWFFSFIIKIRFLTGGLGFLAALLLITKLGDIGAFLVGSRWGEEKKERSTGCNENVAAIEISGTNAVAIPRERMNGTGTKIRVESAIATVKPEIAIVRPALAIVRTMVSVTSLDCATDSLLNRKSISKE